MKTTFRLLMLAASLVAVGMFFIPQQAESRSPRARASQMRNLVSENDVKAEIQFGREVGARILGQYQPYENKELTEYMNLLAAALARNAGRPEITFRVAILKTDNINAYAAPGGYIFVTLGAIKKMQNEAELAAVLAHEMGHITGRHIVRELEIKGSDDSASSGITRMVGGAGDPAKAAFAGMVDKAVGILFERGYKKDDEREADSTAVIFMAMAGYDPSALVSYFNAIKGDKGEDMAVLNKTHPSFKERIDLVNETIEAEGLADMEYTKGGKRFEKIKKSI